MPDPLICPSCHGPKPHDQAVCDICRHQQDDAEPEESHRMPRAFDDTPANNHRDGAD